MHLNEETYHRLSFPQPFINVISEDAHTTDNIINMASTGRVLVATGFVYCEMKSNSTLRLFTTDHSLFNTVQYQIFCRPYSDNNISTNRYLYLQLGIRQRFAFHINRRHLTCRISVGRSNERPHTKQAVQRHLDSCFDRNHSLETIFFLFVFILGIIIIFMKLSLPNLIISAIYHKHTYIAQRSFCLRYGL